MITNSGVSRRTGFGGSVGALPVDLDCPIKKQEEHNKRVVNHAIIRGKVVDNDVHTHVPNDKVQSLKDIGASEAALLGSRTTKKNVA